MSLLMIYSRIGNKLRKPTLWLPQGKTYGNYNVGFRFLLSSAFGCIEDSRKRRFSERKPHFVGEKATPFLFRGEINVFPELYPALPLVVIGRCVLYIFDNVCWLTI